MLVHHILLTSLLCDILCMSISRELFCCQDDHWLYHNTSFPCNQLNQGARSGYKQMVRWAEHQYPAIDVVHVFNKSLLNFMINEQLWAEAEKSKDIDVDIFWMGMKLEPGESENLSDGGNPLSSFFLNRLMNREANDQICVDATRISNSSFSQACWKAYTDVVSGKSSDCRDQWSAWSDCIDKERRRERQCGSIQPGCIVYPETETSDCQILDLVFPENGTILAIAGETLKIQFNSKGNSSSSTVMFRLVNEPVYAILTPDGMFEWTVPSDAVVYDNYYLHIVLYNNEGHQRNYNLTVNIIKCPCTEYYGTCRNPQGQSQGLGVYTCDCQVGRFGTLCENDINECESNPCHPLVDCINLHNMYWCTGCPAGYIGDGVNGCTLQHVGAEATEHVPAKNNAQATKPSVCTGGVPAFMPMPILRLIAVLIFSISFDENLCQYV